jgi:hypothetical protein
LVFSKRSTKAKLERKTIEKSKAKEKLTKVKNLMLLPRQWCYKMFLMAITLFFKCHSLGLQAQSDAAREVSPKGDLGLLSNSRENLRWFLVFARQATYNSKQTFLPQLTVVVGSHL